MQTPVLTLLARKISMLSDQDPGQQPGHRSEKGDMVGVVPISRTCSKTPELPTDIPPKNRGFAAFCLGSSEGKLNNLRTDSNWQSTSDETNWSPPGNFAGLSGDGHLEMRHEV